MAILPDTTPAAKQLKLIKELVDEVYSLKQASDEAESKFKIAKNKLSSIMENAGVDKMTGDSCNVSGGIKHAVSCPKDDVKKIQLFEYLGSKDMDNAEVSSIKEILINRPTLLAMLTINARTFSSWYDKEVEAKVIEGDVDFKLPMVEPYERYSLSIRKRTIK